MPVSPPSPPPRRTSAPTTSPSAIVEEALRQLVKAFRAQQLYLQNNPMHQRAADAMHAAFASMWAQMPDLILTVTETDLLWEEQRVLHEPDKGSDSIPWLCYKDGIRELTIEPGFEREEVVDFFEILQRIRRATPDDDDLVAMLWEREFTHFHYRNVDLAAGSGFTIPMPSTSPPTQLRAQPRAEFGTAAPPQPSGIVNLDDFDGTLHFLDPNEIEQLRLAIQREYDGDLRRNIITILLDMFETQRDAKVRAEIVDNLDDFLVRLFASGALATVAYMLRESAETLKRAPSLTDEQKERLRLLPERSSSPAVLTQLLQTLDELPNLPPAEEMDLLFDTMGMAALETIFEWIGRASHDALRTRLTQVADRLSSSHTGELVRLIDSTVAGVREEAIKRAGALKSAAAVPALARALVAGDGTLRLACVQALAAIGSPGALQAIERVVTDGDREVRLAALRAISARAYRPAYDRLHEIVKGGGARDADLTEKMAIFDAYGAVCGPDGVDVLDKMLNKRGLLRREDPEVRACAAVALGRLGTRPALEALERAASDKDVVVRNAVTRALRAASP